MTGLFQDLRYAARSLARLLDRRTLKELRIAALGPVCAKTARSLGMKVAAEAAEYTIEGLTAALTRYYGRGSRAAFNPVLSLRGTRKHD
jgi:hypothetical protein